ncbi:MAG: hypothetical protein E7576_00690 [Ruminococcaceae bacterium]|nr:hypothetical protein [Oscillospiraceae bacterium]
MAIETERKFLIRLPDLDFVRSQPGCRVRQIRQTYLKKLPGKKVERRLRRVEEDGRVKWIFTRKVKLSNLSRQEDEWELTEREYGEWYGEADTELTKTRYSFPYEGHVMEIDVYPFEIGGPELEGRAVLEVELGGEDEPFEVPEFLEIERELTGTREFSNKTMARKVR